MVLGGAQGALRSPDDRCEAWAAEPLLPQMTLPCHLLVLRPLARHQILQHVVDLFQSLAMVIGTCLGSVSCSAISWSSWLRLLGQWMWQEHGDPQLSDPPRSQPARKP